MNQIINTPDIIGSIPDINGTIGAALTLEDQRESSRLVEEQESIHIFLENRFILCYVP